MIRVIEFRPTQLQWPWNAAPYMLLPAPRRGGWARQVPVDPFPGYAHDADLVRTIAARVGRAFPLTVPVQFSVLPYETPDRTNGQCEIAYDYKGDKPHPWAASIVLWGKRIPPHPAMTRYLVAHEYGHAVEKAIALAHGEPEGSAQLAGMYRKLRGLPKAPRSYGGGTWHSTTGEIFANDFRILVAEIEPEFWPHPGVCRPDKVAAIRKFWRDVT